MKIWTKFILAIATAFALTATPAAAQATRTWVSGVGDDVNPCSRTAPCKTFAGAISKTAAGGEINTLDPGGFGAVTITKAITIRSDHRGGVLASGVNGIIINAAATDKVVIDGLDIHGAGTGLNGIRVLSARDVQITNTSIEGFTVSGISIEGTSKNRVTVSNVTLLNNDLGINLKATANTASAKVDGSLFSGNTTAAIKLDGALNSASINRSSFYGSPLALNILNGATVSTFGNNAVGTTGTDAPTSTTPLM